jgi:hypothetical protein
MSESSESSFDPGVIMTKSQRCASLYDQIHPVEALKLSIALEDAIMVEVPRYVRGGDLSFAGEYGWNRFVDAVAKRVGWSDDVRSPRASRHRLVALITYTLDELTEQYALVLVLSV